tara:strand:- start:2233 stop:2388 length:156 start_codon:yes stop_codon:yes gene_type:complete
MNSWKEIDKYIVKKTNSEQQALNHSRKIDRLKIYSTITLIILSTLYLILLK